MCIYWAFLVIGVVKTIYFSGPMKNYRSTGLLCQLKGKSNLSDFKVCYSHVKTSTCYSQVNLGFKCLNISPKRIPALFCSHPMAIQ